jgi:hypothetical protein
MQKEDLMYGCRFSLALTDQIRGIQRPKIRVNHLWGLRVLTKNHILI